MLQRRLNSTRLAVPALVLALATGCAGIDGTERGAIRENVIEPGITAIGEARDQACGLNATNLHTALETYLLIEGEPAPDEAALVAEGYLRQQTEDWDVVDGVIVAENPACGPVPERVTDTIEIVTDTEPGPTTASPEGVYSEFAPEDIASMGGPECARQFAVVVAGVTQFIVEQGVEPTTLDEVDAAGLFAEPVTMWQIIDDVLRPANGSTCRDFVALEEASARVERCRTGARTLATAREAFLAAAPDEREPSQQELVDAGFMLETIDDLVLLNGVITAVIGGDCDGVDLFASD